MELLSPVLEDGGEYPTTYTRDGESISPPLAWTGVPDGTRELALLFEVTTPSTEEPEALWVVYDLSPDVRELPEDLTKTPEMDEPLHARQGRHRLGMMGYAPPLSTEGRPFRFRFRLLALDEARDLRPGATREELLKAAEGHVLDEARLEVTYTRPRG